MRTKDSHNLAIARRLETKLAKLQAIQQWRQPSLPAGAVDFTSNDYLGLARDPVLRAAVLRQAPRHPLGSTGSRLLSGHSALAADVEGMLADFFDAETALLFPTGYMANLGLLGSLFAPGETVLYDERIHASMHEGLKLSPARCVSFRHNDLEDLAQKLKAGPVHGIVVESLYSMDGDLAPLPRLAKLAAQYRAALIVDEAHAAGVLGPQGRGAVLAAEVTEAVFARLVTFGKAFGGMGAAVLGPQLLRCWLLNRARSQIFATALSPPALVHVQQALPRLAAADEARAHLQALQNQLAQSGLAQVQAGPGAIAAWHQPGNAEVVALAQRAQAAGYDVRPIRSPTVPKSKERIRICLHAYNSPEELGGLLRVFADGP